MRTMNKRDKQPWPFWFRSVLQSPKRSCRYICIYDIYIGPTGEVYPHGLVPFHRSIGIWTGQRPLIYRSQRVTGSGVLGPINVSGSCLIDKSVCIKLNDRRWCSFLWYCNMDICLIATEQTKSIMCDAGINCIPMVLHFFFSDPWAPLSYSSDIRKCFLLSSWKNQPFKHITWDPHFKSITAMDSFDRQSSTQF